MSAFHEVHLGDVVKCLRWDSGSGNVVNVDKNTGPGAGGARWPFKVEWHDKALGIGWYSADELDVIEPVNATAFAKWVDGGDPFAWDDDDHPPLEEQVVESISTVLPDGPLSKAIGLVHGERGRDYDHPYVDYLRTADIFRAMTGVELTVTQAVKFMIAVKLSRDEASPHVEDHLVDAAGYIECLSMVRKREAILSEGGF